MDWTTTLEGAVFIVSTTTFGVSLWSLWNSHLDHRLLRRLRLNGVKRLTITARLIRDISRVTCAAVLMTAALIGLHYPPDADPVAVMLKLAILLVSLLLGLAVYADWRWRLCIDDAIADLERKARL